MYAEAQAAHTGRHLHTSSPLLRVFMASGAEHEFTERFKQERNSASLPDMCFRHVQRCKDNECIVIWEYWEVLTILTLLFLKDGRKMSKRSLK